MKKKMAEIEICFALRMVMVMVKFGNKRGWVINQSHSEGLWLLPLNNDRK